MLCYQELRYWSSIIFLSFKMKSRKRGYTFRMHVRTPADLQNETNWYNHYSSTGCTSQTAYSDRKNPIEWLLLFASDISDGGVSFTTNGFLFGVDTDSLVYVKCHRDILHISAQVDDKSEEKYLRRGNNFSFTFCTRNWNCNQKKPAIISEKQCYPVLLFYLYLIVALFYNT